MRRQKVVGKGKVTVRRTRASRTDGTLRGYKDGQSEESCGTWRASQKMRRVSGVVNSSSERYHINAPRIQSSGPALTPPMLLMSITMKLPAESGGPDPIEFEELSPAESFVPLAWASS
jgi:hypothetical protein